MVWQEQVSERMKGVGTNLLSRFFYPTKFIFGVQKVLDHFIFLELKKRVLRIIIGRNKN